MTERHPHFKLDHLAYQGVSDVRKRRPGSAGSPPPFDHKASRGEHVAKLQAELTAAQNAAIHAKDLLPLQMRTQGMSTVVLAMDKTHSLNLDGLEKLGTVLQVSESPPDADGAIQPDRAVLWLSQDQKEKLAGKIDKFRLTDHNGKPQQRSLVANIREFAPTTFRDLWRETEDPPEETVSWELWYEESRNPRRLFELLDANAEELDLEIVYPALRLDTHLICTVRGNRESIERLIGSEVTPAEIGLPSHVGELFDMDDGFIREHALALAELVVPPDSKSPVVTVLDTGVHAEHPMLKPALHERHWSVLENDPLGNVDTAGHGTQMAGLALYGDLRKYINGSFTEPIQLEHGLESVRIIRSNKHEIIDDRQPALLTINGVSRAEIGNPGARRVFLLAQTDSRGTETDRAQGRPSAWSAALDALAAGCQILEVDPKLVRAAEPESGRQRLFCLSIGNVRDYGTDHHGTGYPEENYTSAAEDPSQAWNPLKIGAFTNLHSSVTKSGDVWSPIAPKGGLSPLSRTGVSNNQKLQAVPDVVFEGGNLHTKASEKPLDHEDGSVITTSSVSRPGLSFSGALLRGANGTSAAAAQAARLAALLASRYPKYTAETIRGLLVNRAEWTDEMTASGIRGPRGGAKKGKELEYAILRKYGWGVPDEEMVLHSDRSDVTSVWQECLQPFDPTEDFKIKDAKFHSMPWTNELIEQIGRDVEVELRVTLSYFVEPNPGRRGSTQHKSYPSHRLNFLVKSPTVSERDFINAVSITGEAPPTETGMGKDRWLLGADRRGRGSLHNDRWCGSAEGLLNVSMIAVVPTTGWWKTHERRERCKLTVPYSLIVTLKVPSAGIDLYTPIANAWGLPVDERLATHIEPEPIQTEPVQTELQLDF